MKKYNYAIFLFFIMLLVGCGNNSSQNSTPPHTSDNTESTTYTITWKNYDGSILEVDENVEYGTMPSYDGLSPVRKTDNEYSYEFLGWSPELSIVTADIDYFATFTREKLPSFLYELSEDGNYYILCGIDSITNEDVIIPSTFKNLPVRKISDNVFMGFSFIRNITIPNSITSIGEDAFAGCNSLTNVYYEGTIEDWCNITFSSSGSNPMYEASHFYMLDENNEWCEQTKIEIPSTVKNIGHYQFYRFDNLLEIIIPNRAILPSLHPQNNYCTL